MGIIVGLVAMLGKRATKREARSDERGGVIIRGGCMQLRLAGRPRILPQVRKTCPHCQDCGCRRQRRPS